MGGLNQRRDLWLHLLLLILLVFITLISSWCWCGADPALAAGLAEDNEGLGLRRIF